jgi:hypothetical protein
VYVEGRYIAPFVMLVLGGLLREARLPAGEGYRRMMAAAGAVMLFFVVLSIGLFNAEGFLRITGLGAAVPASAAAASSEPTSAAGQVEAAHALLELGVLPGEEISFVGYAFGAYFARLAGVRITRQVPDVAAAEFWNADDDEARAVLHDLLAGPAAVVTDWTPVGPSASHWQPLGESTYHVYMRKPQASPSSAPRQSGSQ